MHVSRSQSAFLWLLHYETTPPPPTSHNGGEGGRLPDDPRVFRLFGQRLKVVNRGNFFLWNPESTLPLESGIQILLTRNPKSKFIRTRNQESSTWNVEPADWNPESKTFLDYLTWVDRGHLLQKQLPVFRSVGLGTYGIAC